jgi:hypothetical protein
MWASEGERSPVELALGMLQLMADNRQYEVAPDKMTFLAAMDICAADGRWEKVLFLYEKSR